MNSLYLIVTLASALSCPPKIRPFFYSEECSCTETKDVRFTFDRDVAEKALARGARVFRLEPQTCIDDKTCKPVRLSILPHELKRESKTTFTVSESRVEVR